MAFTNNWSNSSQCNHTFSVINVEHRAEVIALVSFEFFSAFLCISFVILLTVRVKKKLWDTAAKRFHLGLTICSILCFLSEGSLLLVYLDPNYQLSNKWYIGYSFVRIYLYTTYDLYLTASVVWLLLQTGAPILPTRLRYFLSSRQLVVIEAVIQVLIPLLSLTNDIPLFMDYVAYHHYLDMGCRSLPTLSFLVLCVVLGCCVLVLCFTSAILGFFLVRFIKTTSTIRRTKKLILKLTFLCISTITLIVYDFLLYTSSTHPSPIILGLQIVFILFVLVSLMILNYPSDTWCWTCFKKSPSRLPLLPVNNTEGEETNPVSVWNHRCVPSHTTANYPPEMSDCRTDYEEPHTNEVVADYEDCVQIKA